jgi:high-affinity iron transporter
MRLRPFVCLALLVTACTGPATAPPPTGAEEDLRRLAAILDYIAADYAGAVKNGAVIDEGEYREQLSFLTDAAGLAAKVPGADVAPVAKLVAAKAEPAEVAQAARGLRKRLLDEHGLVLAPAAPPSLERGRALFAQSCAACHGPGGGGDGPAGKTLKPPPRSFLDPAAMAEMSAVRAFNAITDGMKGTAMASWTALSASDRWSLAFTVLALRHDAAAAARGQKLVAASARPIPTTAAALAGATDTDLTLALALEEGARKDALAYLRTVAPFQTGGAPLDDARRLLRGVVAAARRGDATAARQVASAAYLDGFEPHEGALRARDPELVTHCEERFLRLREGIGAGAPLATVEREALQLEALLDRAEAVLTGAGGAQLAFVSALVVILREGVEAALLIMLLLGLARRQGGAVGDARSVHLGWLFALGIGVITWFVSEPLTHLGGASRELMEGIVSLLAAAALLVTGHFVIARIDAKHRVDAMKRRLAEAAGGASRRTALAGLAFIAVYREAFEVVLFLRAIALDGGSSPGAMLAGAAAGALVLIGVVAALLRLGKRLKPGPLLATMGTLLCVLAVVLAGKGVRALQEAGVVGIRPLEVPRLEWLGLYPSLEGVLAQLLVLGAFGAIALVALRARRTALAV